MTTNEEPRLPIVPDAARGGALQQEPAEYSPDKVAQGTDTRNRLARAAAAYAARGWPVFPLAPRTKVPLIAGGAGYKDATTEADKVQSWWAFTPNANIGLWPAGVILPDGGGLIVIDVDGPKGRESAADIGLPDNTAAVRTGRPEGGEHRYFRLPPGVQLGNRSVLGAGIDVRNAKGYAVLPPSIHPSGAEYRWTTPPKEENILRLPAHVLERLLPPPAVVAPSSLRWRGGATGATGATERVRRYLLRFPHALADGRKMAAFRLAAFLLHDAELAESHALDILAEWDSQNLPPLGGKLIQRQLHDARRYGGKGGAA